MFKVQRMDDGCNGQGRASSTVWKMSDRRGGKIEVRTKEYKYGMRLRGFAPGCQPMKGLIRREDDLFGDYWDVLVYNRKLEEDEIQRYELDRIK